MSLATENIVSSLTSEEKLLRATVALISLKTTALIIVALVFIAVVLAVFYLTFLAIYGIVAQLAQLWADCSAIEKLIFLALAWAFAAWALKMLRGLRHAA